MNQKVTTDERTLVVTRTFDAPRELVFEMFSSCEHLRHWWGPKQWPMAECTMDFQVGGVWHFCLRGPNEGDESWGTVVYREITRPERIVFQDHFSDEEGNIDEDMPGVLSTWELEEAQGKTTLVMRAEYASPTDLKMVLDMGMVEGMTSSLDRLEEHLVSRH